MVWSEAYEVDIGPHVFPTSKYRRVVERLEAAGEIRREALLRPDPASGEELARVHTDGYLRKIREGAFTPREVRLLEVPFSPGYRRASEVCAGGSLLAGRRALETGIAVHLGGGFHHAFPDHGEGFCLLNDVAVAIRGLQHEGRIERAAVIDCDLHHGNGTAAIFADDPRVFTFSLHQRDIYPVRKPPGDLDVGLDAGTGDAEYLELLGRHLPRILDAHHPEVAVYLAGADPFREDQLGTLRLTKEGLRARDERVLVAGAEAGVPVVALLAGGYARRLKDTVDIHCATVRVARSLQTR